MTRLLVLHETVFASVERLAPVLLPTLARLIFAAVLFLYFWASAMTKLGDGFLGLFRPAMGAYAQIFPKAMEAAGYDVSQLSAWHTLVVLFGTWAEIALPILVVIGLFTRLAALGMIGFVVVQSWVDVVGHGTSGATLGAWFDKASGSLILDQRAFWVFLLLYLVLRGGGPLALDRVVFRQAASG